MARKRQTEKDSDVTVDLGTKIGFTPIGKSDYSKILDFIPTFIAPLDKILGGGIPFGRITEVFSPEAVGKSTFMINLTKIATNLGVDVFWIDTEGTSDPERMTQLGVDVNKAYVFQPDIDSGENMDIEVVQQKIEDILNAYDTPEYRKRPVLVIWDSVGMTESKTEAEATAGDKVQLGRQATAVTALVKKLTARIKSVNMAFIAVNQVRANVNMMNKYDKKFTRPGGKLLEHADSLRLELGKFGDIKQNYDDETTPSKVGHHIHVTTDKNKQTRPKQRVDIALLARWYVPQTKNKEYGSQEVILDGIDYTYNLYEAARNMGLITTGGSYRKYLDKSTGEEVSLYEIDFLRKIYLDADFRRRLAIDVTANTFTREPPVYLKNANIDISNWDETKPIADYYKGVSNAGE